MTEAMLEIILRRDRIIVAAALAALTALAWTYMLSLAADMDMGGMEMTGFRMVPAGIGIMAPAPAPWQAIEFVYVFAMWAVIGIGARDEVEGMLAVQMVGTHYAATRALRRLKGSGMRDNDGNIATKFLRTFAAQIEALRRYRGKGQQKMTIEHVHIHKGGQAIVGSVGR